MLIVTGWPTQGSTLRWSLVYHVIFWRSLGVTSVKERGGEWNCTEREVELQCRPSNSLTQPHRDSGAKMAFQTILHGPKVARPLYPCICMSSEAGPPGEGVIVAEAALCS